ncbi:uncharacterized protein J7T54_001530 [Emericellopsis cladophorae]|uniref:Uncharacterized protein n=1 Tax=Emericellopsis cladophorae TaxID=2686198 RepID=A0A9P9XVB0_9HYPO|nr:uncharacterized protein J7T54_001530 [Emericellopsis cladophorae]KAI6778110.1 hypothetical protein J7T54_001530 [Emericellopsis cladophorae]
MAAATLIAPRYSADDFETSSIRSVAPSYVSEAPSYHSSTSYHQHEPVPEYTPREPRTCTTNTTTTTRNNNSSNTTNSSNNTNSRTTSSSSPPNQPTPYGLPPVASTPQVGLPSIHSFRIPKWSTHNATSSRQLHSVVERRVNASLEASSAAAAAAASAHRRTLSAAHGSSSPRPVSRPLEDPYLVGEEAASRAKQERLARERAGDDVLVREDQHWDWLLAQMKTWDERERSWARFRREMESGHRPKLLHRIGGRI